MKDWIDGLAMEDWYRIERIAEEREISMTEALALDYEEATTLALKPNDAYIEFFRREDEVRGELRPGSSSALLRLLLVGREVGTDDAALAECVDADVYEDLLPSWRLVGSLKPVEKAEYAMQLIPLLGVEA